MDYTLPQWSSVSNDHISKTTRHLSDRYARFQGLYFTSGQGWTHRIISFWYWLLGPLFDQFQETLASFGLKELFHIFSYKSFTKLQCAPREPHPLWLEMGEIVPRRESTIGGSGASEGCPQGSESERGKGRGSGEEK